MITVEIRDASNAGEGKAEVEIFCDGVGLDLLCKQLQHLKVGSSHVHLMTPAWAGNELAATPVGKGTNIVNHLRITMIQK
jgi:hypothetical protein